MASTFKRVNGVEVDSRLTRVVDHYLDPGFTSGAYVSNSTPQNSTIASSGACYRGMPVGLNTANGKLVPISTAGATFRGVLLLDLTGLVIAKNSKVAVATSGRIRSYAGGALNIGDPVKADTSAQFNGFVKAIVGTDIVVGHAYPIDDGSASNGVSAAISMVQGDTIFVELS